MTHKLLTATSIMLMLMFGAAQGRTQTNDPAQATASAPSPTSAPRIVTKDPEYLKLLNPPEGNAFLQTYSQSYRDKAAEIQAKVGGINDENLQIQTRNEEWVTAHKIDGDKFTYEAETAFREAKISFAQKHQDGWFEIGRVAYDENNSVLAVIPNEATPIVAALRVPMKVSTLNVVYTKFHEIAAQEVDQKTQEYVAKAATGSTCSRNPDLCLKYAKDDIEQKLRTQRIIVAAQGDMESMRIDHLLLVDYDTEAVLQELDAHVQGLSSAAWRFSIGPVPAAPVEQASSGAQAPENENNSQRAADSSASSKTPAAPIKVPANVTAASILTKTNPEYPDKARAARIQGDVILHAMVDKEGKVSDVQVLSGDEALAQAAVEAVRQWRYKPMLVDGEPREFDTTITVTFSLEE
jgi:TonB family protein